MPFSRFLSPYSSIDRLGLVVERGSGPVAANVYPVREFSRTGFDCGVLNEGAADLALSVLHTLLPPVPPAVEKSHDAIRDHFFYRRIEADPAQWSKWLNTASCRISMLAWKLHGHFATDVIARLDRDGGHVPILDLRRWLEAWSPVVRG